MRPWGYHFAACWTPLVSPGRGKRSHPTKLKIVKLDVVKRESVKQENAKRNVPPPKPIPHRRENGTRAPAAAPSLASCCAPMQVVCSCTGWHLTCPQRPSGSRRVSVVPGRFNGVINSFGPLYQSPPISLRPAVVARGQSSVASWIMLRDRLQSCARNCESPVRSIRGAQAESVPWRIGRPWR